MNPHFLVTDDFFFLHSGRYVLFLYPAFERTRCSVRPLYHNTTSTTVQHSMLVFLFLHFLSACRDGASFLLHGWMDTVL